ncbi:hypothetical protein JKP88DRAFT_267061 [Tribonema minus]|uniref:Uncharacterized protein n=1 Tax=Tribonema minus TaxID=303371 RepID=A0A836CNN4_9STRA|nr:hypothetical protein JKP88DRAFT_267061 [Tribonema minus]
MVGLESADKPVAFQALPDVLQHVRSVQSSLQIIRDKLLIRTSRVCGKLKQANVAVLLASCESCSGSRHAKQDGKHGAACTDAGVASDDSGGDQADGDDTGQATMDHAVIGGASRNFLADVAMATERVDSLLSRIDAPQVQHDPDDPDAGWDGGRPITQLHQVQFHVAVESQQRSEVVQNLKKLHGNLHAQATHESLQASDYNVEVALNATPPLSGPMWFALRARFVGRDNEQQKLQALHMKIKNMHREWEEMVRKEEDAIRRQRDEQQLRTLMEIEHASDRLTHLKEEHMSLQAQLDRAIARAAVEPSEACNQSLQRYAKKATYLMGAIRQQQQWVNLMNVALIASAADNGLSLPLTNRLNVYINQQITAALEGAEEAEADGKRLNADLKVLAEMERAALAAHHQHQQQPRNCALRRKPYIAEHEVTYGLQHEQGKQQSGGLQALTMLAGLKRQLEREMKTLAVADEMASRQRPLLLAEQEQLLRDVQAGNAAKHAREQLEASAARRVAEVEEQSAALAAAAEAAAAQLAELQPKLLALFAQHMYAEPEHTSSSSSDDSGSGTDSEDLSDDGAGAADTPAPEAQRREQLAAGLQEGALRVAALHRAAVAAAAPATTAAATDLMNLIRGTSSTRAALSEPLQHCTSAITALYFVSMRSLSYSLGRHRNMKLNAPEHKWHQQAKGCVQQEGYCGFIMREPLIVLCRVHAVDLIVLPAVHTMQAPVPLLDSAIRALSGAAAWKLLHVAHKAGTLSDAEVASVKTQVLWQGQELSRDNCQLVHDLDTALGEAMTGPRSQQGSPAAVPLIHTGHLGRVAVEYQAASMAVQVMQAIAKAVQGFMHVAGCNMMMQALHPIEFLLELETRAYLLGDCSIIAMALCLSCLFVAPMTQTHACALMKMLTTASSTTYMKMVCTDKDAHKCHQHASKGHFLHLCHMWAASLLSCKHFMVHRLRHLVSLSAVRVELSNCRCVYLMFVFVEVQVTRCSADNDKAATSIMHEGAAEAMRQVVTMACTGHGLTGAAALLCAVTLGQLCINSRTEVTSAAPPEWQLPSALHKVVMAAAAAAATPAQRQQQQDQSVTSAPGVGNSERGQGRQEVSTPQIAESRPTAQLLTGGMRSVLLAVAALCDLRSGFHSVMDTDAAAQLAQQMVKVLVTFEQDSASPAPSLRASLLTSSLSSVTAWLNKLRGLTAAARNFILQCDAKPSLQPCKLAVMEALLHLHGLTTSSSGPTEQLVQLYLTAQPRPCNVPCGNCRWLLHRQKLIRAHACLLRHKPQVEPESMVDMVEMPAARLRPGTSPDSNLFHSRSFEPGREEHGINTSQREHTCMYRASDSSDNPYRRSRPSASGAISSDFSDSTPRDSWETTYSQTTGSMVDVASSPRESKVVSGASRASSCSDAGGQRANNSQLRAAVAVAVAATGGALLRPHRPLAPALTISTPAMVPVDNTTSSGFQPETSCGGSQVGSGPGTGCESSRPGSASLQGRLSAAMSRQGSNSGLATACDHPAMASQAADSSRVKSEDVAAAAAAVAMLLGNTRRSGYHKGGVSQHQMVSTPQVTGDPVAAPSCRQRSTPQAASPRASTVLRPASPRGSTIVRGSFASAASATSLVASHTPSSTSRVRDDEGMSGCGHSPRASSSPQVLSPRNSASVLALELSTKGCAPGLGAARSPRTSVMSAASDGLVRMKSSSNRGPADTPNPTGHAASLRSMAAARRVGPDLLSAVTQALDSPIMKGPPLEDVLSNHGARRRSICGQFTEGWLALQEALQANDDQGSEVDVSEQLVVFAVRLSQITGMEREALLLQKMREQMAALFGVPFTADSTRPNAAVSASQEHSTIYKYQPPQGLSSQSMLALMSKLLSELGKLLCFMTAYSKVHFANWRVNSTLRTALSRGTRRSQADQAVATGGAGQDSIAPGFSQITVLEVQLDTLKAELAAMDTDTARAKQEEQDLKALQHQEYTLAKLLAAKTLLLGTTPKPGGNLLRERGHHASQHPLTLALSSQAFAIVQDEASRSIANLKQELHARNDELQDMLYKLRLIRSDPKRLASGAGLEGVLMTPEERADLDARLKRRARRARALQRVVSALRRKWDTFKAQTLLTVCNSNHAAAGAHWPTYFQEHAATGADMALQKTVPP